VIVGYLELATNCAAIKSTNTFDPTVLEREREREREREMAVRQRAVGTLPNLIRSLRKESPNPKLTNPVVLPSLRRAFSLYDQINLIDNVPEDQLRFQGYTETGFKVNGVDYQGSLLCVGNFLMSWAPTKFSDITPDRYPLISIPMPLNSKPYFLFIFL
jgi:hypothetical protein